MTRPDPRRQVCERCPSCGADLLRSSLADYACPWCGRFLTGLYRREHAEPTVGRRLTIAQIKAKYREAGRALPGWLP